MLLLFAKLLNVSIHIIKVYIEDFYTPKMYLKLCWRFLESKFIKLIKLYTSLKKYFKINIKSGLKLYNIICSLTVSILML